LLHFSE